MYKILRNSSKSILNEAKQPIRFGMAYDSRCLGETGWVGVILRNLPLNATSSGILGNFVKAAQENLQDYKRESLIEQVPYRIVDLVEPVKIKEQFCTVLTVPDIEEAERICLRWDQVVVNEK